MISSNAFDYMNVLNKAASASWEREQLISNNIADADTPGYKRRDLDFESTLESNWAKANMFHWMTRWQISIWTI